MPPRRDPLLARALLEAEQRYGAQGAALRTLLSEHAAAYTRTRRTNASTARGIVAATQQARPEMSQAFDQALGSSQAARSALGVDTADPQAQAYTRRVSEQRSQALNALTDRATRAEEGRAFANQQARSEYMGGKAKIQGQIADLLRESGQATATRYADLLDEQRKVSLEEAKFREERRSNRASEATAQQQADTAAQRATQEARGKSKPKWATPKDQATMKDEIERAISLVKYRRAAGDTSRAAIIALLTRGRASSRQPVVDERGKPVLDAKGKPVMQTLPAIPALSGDAVRAATNIVFDQSLSRGDVQRLHARRIKVKPLGYPLRPAQPVGNGTLADVARGRRGGRIGRRPPVPGLR